MKTFSRNPSRAFPHNSLLYGQSISTEFLFSIDLPPGPQSQVITFSSAPTPIQDAPNDAVIEAYDAYFVGQKREFVRFETNGTDVLRFEGIIDYYLDFSTITYYLYDTAWEFFVEIGLFGTVMPYWLERSGCPTLHASAVANEQGAIAILGTGECGKSSIAASLMREGCALVTDDALGVELDAGRFFAIPSYPALRMWPDTAEHFVGSYQNLGVFYPGLEKRVVPVGYHGFGTFATERQALRAIYLLDASKGESSASTISIQRLSPADAMIDLIRLSKMPITVESAGWQPQRLEFFRRIVRDVPVRRLILPKNLDSLPEVAKRILDDAIVASHNK